MVTFNPLACNNFASEAATIPLPNEEVTPPVTKMYFDIVWSIYFNNNGIKDSLKADCFGKIIIPPKFDLAIKN